MTCRVSLGSCPTPLHSGVDATDDPVPNPARMSELTEDSELTARSFQRKHISICPKQ